MPVRPDDVLRKVTLNLYEADVQWFEREYGHGWSERLRQHIHSEVIQRRSPVRRRILGDLFDE